MLQAEALAHVFEAAAYGQRRRGQHRRIPVCRTARSCRMGATSMGVACRKTFCLPGPVDLTVSRVGSPSAARSRRQYCGLPIPSGIQAAPAVPARAATKLKTSSGFDGSFSSSEPRRIERLLQSQEIRRRSLPETRAGSRRQNVRRPGGNSREEKLRPLAQAFQRARQRMPTAV